MIRQEVTRILLVCCVAGLCWSQGDQSWGKFMLEGEHLRKQGQFADALRQYEQASGAGLAAKNQALAQFRMAQMYERLNDTDAALIWYKESLARLHDSDTEAAIKRIESARFGRVVKSPEIVRSLSVPRTKSQHVEPSIDLPVHFDLDKSSLTAAGMDQVMELGRALSDPSFTSGRFRIIGHTDKRGSDFHNQELSEQRARTVRDALCARFNLDPNRFFAVGMGCKQLLVVGNDEEAHRLNRRVEVIWTRE